MLLGAFLFVLGLAVGSFLSSATFRIPRGESLWGRSQCPFCKKEIAALDNIPLVSFILLSGRCRHCRKKISFRYPLIELSTAILFVALGWAIFQGSKDAVFAEYQKWLGILTLPYFLFIASVLIAIFVIDLEHKIIPDSLLYPSILISLLALLFSPSPTLFVNLSVAIFASLFFFFLHILTRGRGMGLGDVKLAFLLGLILGYPYTLLAIFLAFLTGAVSGLMLVLTRKAKLGKPIPFGPYLVAGAFVAIFFGDKILPWLI